MALNCPRCDRTIEFSGERPSFCPYCGVSLSSTHDRLTTEQTAAYIPSSTELTSDHTSTNGVPGVNNVPSEIGGFRLIRLLGAGGMGEVFEGVSGESGQRVAVKLLTAMAKATASSLDRFRQEGRLASQLSHPNCVFVLDADEESGRPYIVMELMPGETLKEYVQTHGPLSADDAIAKILNVIDGLIEAHRLNILHRDVKPSNCFLMADGRVKIGDFGLSKSLSVDGNLTQTGSFLGTVLYAAPEQIKGETLDFSADIYSVAGTLYYLLTGQAPFQHESPTAVISRVITESPPDIGLRRPDLPRRLQKIVMRGLERQPEKRFQSLEEFRAALMELVCRPVTRGGLGARLAAFVIDMIVLVPFWISLAVVETWFKVGDWPLFLVPALAYYVVTEFFWGCSVGKWILRLRVRDACGGLPQFRDILVRTLAYLALLFGAGLIGDDLLGKTESTQAMMRITIFVAGWVAVFVPMRSRSGYRGLHEWISGTRVVQMPWPRPTRRIVPRHEWRAELEPLSTVPGLPASFGGFEPSGIMERNGKWYRLDVCDSMLRRSVMLFVRPEGEVVISEARRALARPQRTRWLAGGVTDGWAWDAFLAPAGMPLTAITAGGQQLGWPATFSILEQLCDEIAAARNDGTLAGPIRADHVFVRADGQVQLLDALGGNPISESEGLELIREVAPLALEGKPRPTDKAPGRVRAVMPLHASEVVNRLFGIGRPITNVDHFRSALRELETRPSETTTPQRIIGLGLQGMLIALPISFLLLIVGLFGFISFELVYFTGIAWHDLQHRIATQPDELVTRFPKLKDPDNLRTFSQVVAKYARVSDSSLEDATYGLNGAERLCIRLTDPFVKKLRTPHINDSMLDDLVERVISNPSEVDESSNALPPMRDFIAQSIYIEAAVVAGILVVWSFVFRGGISLAAAGLALVRADGRRAARWQCALRAIIIWVPPLFLLCLCVAVKAWRPQWVMLHNALWFSSVLWLVGYAVIGILKPGRGPQDRLSGVWVVPR